MEPKPHHLSSISPHRLSNKSGNVYQSQGRGIYRVNSKISNLMDKQRQKPRKKKSSKIGHDSYYRNGSRNLDSEQSAAIKSMEESGMILAMSSQGSNIHLSPKN